MIILILLAFRLPLLFNLFKVRRNGIPKPVNANFMDDKTYSAEKPVNISANSIIEKIPTKQ